MAKKKRRRRAQAAPSITTTTTTTTLLLLGTISAAAATTKGIINTETSSSSSLLSAPTPTPSSSVSPELSDDKTFRAAILNSTNAYRRQHNASAVSWNGTLERFANDYLSIVVKTNSKTQLNNAKDEDENCKFAHSGGPYGENLALGCSDATSCVQMWGDERRLYDYDRPVFGHDTGHFTQLVWKDTTAVGCGRKLCRGGTGGSRGWYLVCEYWPRGNVVGFFDKEVGRPVEGSTPAAGDAGPFAR
ncbi:CAP domain-containing protein [Xylariaceae sp. FL0594]|nr:CAP domain-containing protein [Xylariaceae sp. FL0594]